MLSPVACLLLRHWFCELPPNLGLRFFCVGFLSLVVLVSKSALSSPMPFTSFFVERAGLPFRVRHPAAYGLERLVICSSKPAINIDPLMSSSVLMKFFHSGLDHLVALPCEGSVRLKMPTCPTLDLVLRILQPPRSAYTVRHCHNFPMLQWQTLKGAIASMQPRKSACAASLVTFLLAPSTARRCKNL